MKKLVIGIIGVIAIIGIFYIFSFRNDLKLNKFARQLFDLELPQGSSVVEEKKICGKLNGNGNSMDYLACLLIKSNKSKQELDDYLNNLTFHCVENQEKECTEKEVVKVDGEILQSKYLEHETIMFESLEDEMNFSNYYALVIYDGGYSSDFDIRGH